MSPGQIMVSNNTTNNKFTKGHQLWKQRAKHGVDAMYTDPQKLFENVVEYFQWAEDNPLVEEKVGFSKGRVLRTNVYHPRALTIWGLTVFLGISEKTWFEWRKNRADLEPVISWAEKSMKEMKFSAAAAGLLNANIISREMGLADRQIVDAPPPQMIIAPPQGPAPPTPLTFDGEKWS